jgi:multicomponent Na+:H+ antiporter subunit D
MNWAITGVFIVPCAGGTVAFFAGRKAQALIGMLSAVGTLMILGSLSLEVVRSGVQAYAVGGWAAPLGIQLRCDGLSLLMLLLTAAVSLPASVYALSYFSAEDERKGGGMFWPLWLFLWGGLNCLFVSGDIFNLYLLLEFTLLCSVALASLAGSRAAFVSAFRYLIAATAAALFYLAGVALVYSEYSALDIEGLKAAMPSGFVPALALVLMAGGLSLKSALFPFHFWLPLAHSTAPAPVSAVLSALVVKAGFYVMLRIWFELFPSAPAPLGQVVAGLGAAAVVWGSWKALRQERLKMLIAYSTVAQMGYLFLMFPLASQGGKALEGAAYQVISHGLAKAAMFLGAGALQKAAGTDLIKEARGGFRKSPFAVLSIMIGGASLAGLAPGWGAKGKLLEIVIGGGQWWWAVPIAVGMPLAAAYTFRAVWPAFGRPKGKTPEGSSRTMEAAAFSLAILAVAASFFSDAILAILETRAGP